MDSRSDVKALVFVADDPMTMLSTVVSLRASEPALSITVAGPRASAGRELGHDVELLDAPTLALAVNQSFSNHDGHLLLVTRPAIFPADALATARRLLEDDLTIATVSFWSNAAGMLSFPHRNGPSSHQVENLDADEITRRLRDRGPELAAAPIPHAAGPVVLLAGPAHDATGPLPELGFGQPEPILVDLSFRGRSRGFVDVLEPTTFIARPFDVGRSPESGFLDLSDRHLVYLRHPTFPHLADHEQNSTESPLGVVHAAARPRALGLRVLVDGTCLGPKEMGTQVQTLALVRALSRRSDVSSVSVAIPGPVPAYADTVLGDPKVEVRAVRGSDFSEFSSVDVVHRPFQPDDYLDLENWRRVGRRVVITLQDLIAYRVGAYHGAGDHWLRYRDALRRAVREADGIVAISEDTIRSIERERLPISADRCFVVPNGTDHLRGDEPARIPETLRTRGFVGGQFLLVIGVNYSHKNRDLALRALAVLLDRGWELSMVLVGASAPHGSSRHLEAAVGASRNVFTIADVTSEERNWLMRHAAINLYPTSAEGFGLVPYEAARFGTPTVLVPFGPLGEIAGDLPVLAESWSPEALADAAERLLRDPALASAQVDAALSAGDAYTWDRTAEREVAVYHELLRRVAR
jgi:glycosyltransferase involved in cell wall biosynthesis